MSKTEIKRLRTHLTKHQAAALAFGAIFVLLFWTFGFGLAKASGPSTNLALNYQARITDSNGVPLADGSKNIKFTIYDASSGGNCEWTAQGSCGSETAKSVTVASGTFSTLLGGSGDNAMPTALFSGDEQRYLELQVETTTPGVYETLSPRKRIVSSAFSMNANLLDDLDTSASGGSTAFVPVTDSGGNFTLTKNVNFATDTFFVEASTARVGIGTTSPGALLDLTAVSTDNAKAFNLSALADTDGDDVYGTYSTLSTGTGTAGDYRTAYGAYRSVSNAVDGGAGAGYVYATYNDFSDISGDWAFTGGTYNYYRGAIGSNAYYTGLTNDIVPSATASNSTVIGVDNSIRLNGAAGTIFGIRNALNLVDGAANTNAAGTFSPIITDSGDSVAHFHAQSSGTGGTQYGVYLNMGDADVTNYGVYEVAGATNYFAGNVGIGDSDPAASLTVGSGDLFQVAGATGNVTTSGDVAVNGGDLTSSAATANLFNATPTTVNVGGAATTLNLAGGSASTGCTINGSGDLTCTGAVSGSGALSGSGSQYQTAVWTGTYGLSGIGPGTGGQLLISQGAAADPAYTTMGGDATITSGGSLTIAADAVALGTDTTGNYVATVSAGSGIGVTGADGEGSTKTVALGPLTADWNQTGAFDIALNNAGSELKILGSAGTYYGILDAGALTASDKTYTFPNVSGTVITTGNLTDITTVGTISTGTWQGTAVGAAYGGTGQSSYTTGDILYASGATALSKLSAGTSGYVLTSNGAGSAPSWQAASGGVGGSGAASHVAYWTDASNLSYDSNQLYWDATNNRLGIGTNAPNNGIQVAGLVNFVDADFSTYLGYQAGNSVTANNDYVTAVGYQAVGGASVGTALDRVTALGYRAGYALTSGADTTLIGYQAGLALTSGVYSTAVGSQALVSETTGQYGTAVGYMAQRYFDGGYDNTAVGAYAMQGASGTSDGQYNTALGAYSLYGVTSGNENTAVGDSAGYSLTSGQYNTAIGSWALSAADTGSYNVAVGYGVAWSLTNAQNVVAIGHNAFYSGNSSNNVAIGDTAGRNITSTENVSIGSNAGYYANTQNVAIGYAAGYGASGWTSNNYNVSLGYLANRYADAAHNIALGYQANAGDSTNGTGTGAVAIGWSAGQTMYGSYNVSLGYGAQVGSGGGSGSAGANNVGIGYQAAYNVLSGNGNISIGYRAGYAGATTNDLTTGSNNVFLGYDSAFSDTSQYSRAAAIGYQAKVGQNDAIVLGDTGNSSVAVGIGDPTPSATLTVGDFAGSETFTVAGATGNVTASGDVAANGGDLTTTAATGNLFNTNATTVNVGGAATTLNLAGGSASTGCTIDSSGNLSCTGSVGSGMSNPMTTLGDIIYGGASGTPTRLAGSSGVLHSTGAAAPTWGAVSLTADVSGTLPVGNGGTGTATTFTQGSVVFAGASGVYSQDNSYLYYDATNHRLGIGVTGPSQRLAVVNNSGGTVVVSSSDAGLGVNTGLEFNYNSGTGGNTGNIARIMAETQSGGGGDLLFQTAPSAAGAYATKLTLSRAGDLTLAEGTFTVSNATATYDQIAIASADTGAARFTGTVTNADLTAARTYTLPDASGTFITTGNLTSITTVGTIGTGTWQGTAVGAAYGGTGLTSYSTGDMIYATAATTLAKLTIGTSGYVMTSTGSAPQWTQYLGVGSGGTGTGTTFTQGSVIFAGASGIYSQDNSNFYWDGTNHRLGIGVTGPSQRLAVLTPDGGTAVITSANAGAGANTGLEFNFNSGTGANTGNIARIMANTVTGGGGDLLFQTAPSTAGSYTTKLTLNRAGDLTLALGTLTVSNSTAAYDQIAIASADTGAARFTGTVTNADLTAARTYTLPDASGTFITTGNLTSITTVGTITTGTWQGTEIADAYVSNTLTASNLVGSGSTTNAVDLATAEVNGILPVGNGGTGATTFTANGVLYGNTTSAVQVTAAGTDAQLLLANASGVPTFVTMSGDASITNAGVVTVANDSHTHSGYATTALDNLASVAINDHLIPDSNDDTDLGSTSLRWQDIYLGPASIHIGTNATDEGTITYDDASSVMRFATDSTTNADISFFTDDLYLDKSTGRVGIGDASPDAQLDIQGTGEQLRLSYDDSNYGTLQVDSAGNLYVKSATGTADTFIQAAQNLYLGNGATTYIQLGRSDTDVLAYNQGRWIVAPSQDLSGTQSVSGLTATIAGSSAGETYYGYTANLTNNQTTNANTVIGFNMTFTDSGSLANTVYGAFIDARTANASDTTTGLQVYGNDYGIYSGAGDNLFTGDIYANANFRVTSGAGYIYGSKFVLYDDRELGFGGGAGTQDISVGYRSADDMFVMVEGTDVSSGDFFTYDPTNNYLNIGGDATPGNTFSVGSTSQFQINSSGQVASGTWQGTAVAAAYGGTGQTSYTTGDILYASAATTLSKLAAGTSGYVLTSNGAGSAPSWQAAGGGMSNPMTTLGDIIYGGASGTPTRLAGSSGVLHSTGAAAPSWGAVSLTADVSGTLPIANGGTNATSYTSSQFLWYNGSSIVASGYSNSSFASSGHSHTSAAGWTDGGATVYLTGSGDEVTVGSSSSLAKLAVDGDTAAQIQFLVQGATSQSSDLLVVENSAATDLFKIASDGAVTMNNSSTAGLHIGPNANTYAIWLEGASSYGIYADGPGNNYFAGNMQILGNITSATWQGDTVGIAYGGTNATTYTTNQFLEYNGSSIVASGYNETSFAASSHNHSAANITSGTLAIARGGTNSTSYTSNQFLWYNGSSIVASGYSNGSFLTSESDTLATVTGRGATTNTTSSFTKNASFQGYAADFTGYNNDGIRVGTNYQNTSYASVYATNSGGGLAGYFSSASPNTTYPTLYALSTTAGVAIKGVNTSTGGFGVHGTAGTSSGYGVYGYGYYGVYGLGGTYGGYFSGTYTYVGGKFGVNNTTPTYVIDAYGTGNERIRIRSASTNAVELNLTNNYGSWNMYNNNNLYFYSSVKGGSAAAIDNNGYFYSALPSNSSSYTMCYNGSTSWTTHGYCSSSRRFKENIEPLVLDEEKFYQLQGSTFSWISTGEYGQGMIAEDTAELFPELATYVDGQILSVDYFGFTAYLLEALKLLNGRALQLESNGGNLYLIDASSPATAEVPLADSRSLSFRGSYYDGVASSVETRELVLANRVASGDSYRLSLADNDGSEVAYFGSNGDIALSGNLYPSDRGALQTDKYIYYDGDTGPGGDMMRTNAAGWGTGSYDFAEMFPSEDVLAPGELVMIDVMNETKIKRAAKDDVSSFLLTGIISTRPGFLAGMNEVGSYPVALSGRVPTKVSLENGAINIGDPITISSAPGIGMKALESGYVVGIALESLSALEDGKDYGTVTVYVRTGWFNGATVEEVGENVSGDSASSQLSGSVLTQNLDAAGYALVNVGAISGLDGLWQIDGNGNLMAQSLSGEDITAKEVKVKVTDDTQTIGSAKLPANESTVTVQNPAVKANSKVFITFRRNPSSSWWLAEVFDGGFIVSTEQPVIDETQFDYWIVNVVDETTPPEEEDAGDSLDDASTAPTESAPADSGSSDSGDSGTDTPVDSEAGTDTGADAPADTPVDSEAGTDTGADAPAATPADDTSTPGDGSPTDGSETAPTEPAA